MIEALRKVIKRMHYPLEVMLTCVRWYVAYPPSLRHIDHGTLRHHLLVDHATVHHWAMKIVPASPQPRHRQHAACREARTGRRLRRSGHPPRRDDSAL